MARTRGRSSGKNHSVSDGLSVFHRRTSQGGPLPVFPETRAGGRADRPGSSGNDRTGIPDQPGRPSGGTAHAPRMARSGGKRNRNGRTLPTRRSLPLRGALPLRGFRRGNGRVSAHPHPLEWELSASHPLRRNACGMSRGTQTRSAAAPDAGRRGPDPKGGTGVGKPHASRIPLRPCGAL